MRKTVAIAAWQDHVATTCDFSKELIVTIAEHGHEISRQTVMLDEKAALPRARHIQSLGVQVLLCGAISHRLGRALADAGIDVFPYISGPVNDVLAAYLCGQLTRPCFLQPGCRSGARRRWRHNMRRRAHTTGGQNDAGRR